MIKVQDWYADSLTSPELLDLSQLPECVSNARLDFIKVVIMSSLDLNLRAKTPVEHLE